MVFRLELEAQEIDLIGAALGKQPFEVVSPLLSKIVQQVQKQQQPKDKKVKTPAKEVVAA